MKWFDKLERKFGKYAIKNLIYYIIAIYAMGFVILHFFPQVYYQYLALDVSKVLEGQVWRVFTFILFPPDSSLFFLLISLYFYFFLGTILENAWGAFKFNIYYISGVLFTVIAAFIIYFTTGWVYPMGIYYINMAMFLAFATIMGEMQILLFFLIPIKVKWLAYFDGVFILATIVFGYAYNILPANVVRGLFEMGIVVSPVTATEALVSLLNFGIFLLVTKVHRKSRMQKKFVNAVNQATREAAKMDKQPKQEKIRPAKIKAGTLVHKCAVCGRTSEEFPDMEFRYCSKCYSNYEYCSEHLYTHRHVTAQDAEPKA